MLDTALTKLAFRYCGKVYQNEPNPKGVFLQLLRIYLHPVNGQKPRLEPALKLIATHGTRIDAQEVLDLLPSVVTMQDVREFFVKTLRDGHAKINQSVITKQLLQSRKEQVDRGLMKMQQKRVRITDIRMSVSTYESRASHLIPSFSVVHIVISA